MGKATQDLKKEHDAILHVLKIVDRAIGSNKPDSDKLRFYGELLYFLKIFADKCHHGKEENYLFTALTAQEIPNQGGPVGVMLKEHEQGRQYLAAMSEALENQSLTEFGHAATGYRDLLRNHIEKENQVLFVMADQVLNEVVQDELFEKFEEYEESVIGHGVHEELHAMIDRWSREF